jgi:signal transduction histidine kinase
MINMLYLIGVAIMIMLLVWDMLTTMQKKVLEKLETSMKNLLMKDVYQAAMVHELRNPLNSVIGGVDLISNSKGLS